MTFRNDNEDEGNLIPTGVKITGALALLSFVGFLALLMFTDIFSTEYQLGWKRHYGKLFEDAQTEQVNHSAAKISGDNLNLGNRCAEIDKSQKAGDTGHVQLLQGMIVEENRDRDIQAVPKYLRGCLTKARAADQ